MMQIDYDEDKSDANMDKHGLSFDEVELFEWNSCITVEDTRYDYCEQRFISYGYIARRLHVLVWTPRGNRMRIISLRKAKEKERKRYG